ncbi:MAG: DUF4393 domain-containing protein [Oscillospiraceae bacterium]|nr:DUF4393 domain-containing protein [Oscillospiraceae bacterium]
MAGTKKILGLVPDAVDHAAENLIGPSTKGIGQTLADCWELVLGGHISYVVAKQRIKYKIGLERFREGLKEKTEKIPEEKRTEGTPHIIMVVMQNALYCIEDDSLRGMFENLIASSVDSETKAKVHPSFAHALCQMTAEDVNELKKISLSGSRITEVIVDQKAHGEAHTKKGVLAISEEQAISINVLAMFGLVTTHRTHAKFGLKPKIEVVITEYGLRFLEVCTKERL